MVTERNIGELSAPGDAAAQNSGCGPLRPIRTDLGAPAIPLRQQIFESVRAEGVLSRVEIARLLGVSPGSVTAAATDLIAAGYLREIAAPARAGEMARGRPPVALAVRPEAGLVAGVQIADGTSSAVLYDFAGRPVAQASRTGKRVPISPSEMVRGVGRLLDDLLAEAGRDESELGGVGVGLPGFIDGERGTVLWSRLLATRNIDLAALLTRRIGRPVWIDNDANLVTLAELWFGDGRNVSNFAVVTIEHGIGMGLVLDNRLYRGARGVGTELGHTKVQLDGALCRCGQRGCLEAYVADYALIREASTALDSVAGKRMADVTLSQLFAEAKSGNAAARSIFRRAGRYLALGLANVSNLFDPDLIILSGERMEFDYLYADEVLGEMRQALIQIDRPAPRVEIHAWGNLIWARGAAALALGNLTGLRLGATGVLEDA